jgi:hypothetical protein
MSRLERLAPLTGVVVVVFTVVAFVLAGDSPDFTDDPQAIADYYADDPGKLQVAFYIDAVGTFFLIWFAGSVRTALRTAEGGLGRLSAVSFGGAVVAGAMFLAYDAANIAAAFRADEDGAIDPAVAASLWDVGGVFLGMGGAIASAVFVTAAAVVALRRRAVLPVWFAWASVALAIVLVSPFGWVGLIGFLLWVLIVSVMLYVAQGRAAPAAPIATASPSTQPPA